jgi:hypothetical protein
MQPRVAGRLDSERQERVVSVLGLTAAKYLNAAPPEFAQNG